MTNEEPDGFADGAAVRDWLSAFILRERDPARVLSVTARVVGRFLRVSRVCFGEIDIAAERAFFLPDWTDGVPSIEGPQPFYPESEFGRLYAQGRPIAFDDYSRLSLVRNEEELLERSADLAFIAVPLLDAGRVVGVFAASDHRPRRWTEAEVALMGEIGPMIWRAYEHRLALERLAEAERLLRAPAEAGRAETGLPLIDHFTVATTRGDLRVPLDRIAWIEAERDYVVLHAASGNHVLRRTMAELEAGLDPQAMLRVHRSAIVSLAAVRAVERRGRRIVLILRSGAEVPVSAAHVAAVRARLGAGVGGAVARPVAGTRPGAVIRSPHVGRDWRRG